MTQRKRSGSSCLHAAHPSLFRLSVFWEGDWEQSEGWISSFKFLNYWDVLNPEVVPFIYGTWKTFADPLTQSYPKSNKNPPWSCLALSLTHRVQDQPFQPLSHQPFPTPCTPLLPPSSVSPLCWTTCKKSMFTKWVIEYHLSTQDLLWRSEGRTYTQSISMKHDLCGSWYQRLEIEKPLCINNSTYIQQPD